jgi:hypothetical protein
VRLLMTRSNVDVDHVEAEAEGARASNQREGAVNGGEVTVGPFLRSLDRHGLLEDRQTERGALSCPCSFQPPLAAPGLAH